MSWHTICFRFCVKDYHHLTLYQAVKKVCKQFKLLFRCLVIIVVLLQELLVVMTHVEPCKIPSLYGHGIVLFEY